MEGREPSSLRAPMGVPRESREWSQGPAEPDPYDEIEMYLNKAKEDIVIALKSSPLEVSSHESENDTNLEPSSTSVSVARNHQFPCLPSSPTGSNSESRPPVLEESLNKQHRGNKFGFTHGHRRPSSLKDSRLQEWSQGLLKDFQDLVQEELKSLNSPVLEKSDYFSTSSTNSGSNISDRYISEGLNQSIEGSQSTGSEQEINLKKDGSSHHNLNGNFITVDANMGVNQSAIKVSDNWEDEFYTPYKTYTLPRSNQRSVSLVGERLASSGHPDDPSESCRLISVTHHRFSRSLSLDESRGLSPWAMERLRLIDDSHRNQKDIHSPADTDISFPEGIYGKIRKTGISQTDNEKLLIANDFSDSPELKRLSNGWSNSHGEIIDFSSSSEGRNCLQNCQESELPKLDFSSSAIDSDFEKPLLDVRPSSVASATSSALTIEALGERDGDGWSYADDDDSCLLMRGRFIETGQDTEDGSLSRPEIVVTFPVVTGSGKKHSSLQGKINDASTIPEDKGKQRKMREIGGRKSEPSFPSPRVVPASPLLCLPGLEVRRHTLPNPANKNGNYADTISLDIPGTPIFNTSSWETLPPVEEMEVMENKPIQLEETHQSLERPPSREKSITSSRSLNSSLSSLSQLSLQDDFSENELWSPCSKSPDSESSNSTEDPLVKNSFSPDVFLDPSQIYPHRNGTNFLNNLNKDKDQEENSLKGVIVDTKPVIIKLTPKVIKDISTEDKSDTRKVIHKTQSSLLKNNLVKETDEERKIAFKDKNIKSFKSNYEKSNNSRHSSSSDSLSEHRRFTPNSHSSSNELVFTVTVSEACQACSEMGAESDSCNNTLDRRKDSNDLLDHVMKVNHDDDDDLSRKFESLVIAEKMRSQDSEQNDSEFVTIEGDNLSLLKRLPANTDVNKVKLENDEDEAGDVDDEAVDDVLRSVKQFNHFDKRKKRNKGKSTKETFADFELFLKAVETRIPSSKEAAESFGGGISPVVSLSSGDLLSRSPSFPTVVLDASTQTPFSPSTPACDSPNFSSMMSECGCDGASLEPYCSSIALSATEDDLDDDECEDEDDDDWWVMEGSLSSSPPETPVSQVRDDSSMSLSESLDNLDQNVESGLGTVSTRPSASPPVPTGPLDLSGSNLSSEDTGLETSFERRVRRYLPNARYGRSSDHSAHYRRRRPLTRAVDSWVRRENQTTQTDTRREVRASSEEAQTKPWVDDAPSSEGQGVHQQQQVVRHTHSEPRLSALSNPNLSLRVFNSEATLPPLPTASPSRSFCSPSPLPTVSEGASFAKGHFNRPRNLSLGEVHVPSKAVSAPILERGRLRPPVIGEPVSPSDETPMETLLMTNRTQSEKELSEIEALEACKWLRAAGFPQYAQMYEDFQFPLDLVSVERDHSFLDVDSLQALFRRLKNLNRCAKIRLDSTKREADESEDEEQQCALSGNWTFQRHCRRWSRIDTSQLPIPSKPVDLRACGLDRILGISEGSEDVNAGQFKRSGSERLKDGAKAFLRRMESLKNKKKRRHRDGIVISSPKVLDEAVMQMRMTELGCIDIALEGSPPRSETEKTPFGDIGHNGDSMCDTDTARDSTGRQTTPGEDSSSLASDHSQSSTPRFRTRRNKRFWRKGLSGEGVNGGDAEGLNLGVGAAYSDSECSPPTWRHYIDDTSNAQMGFYAQDLTTPADPDDDRDKPRPCLRHSTSLTYGKESQKIREKLISSLRGVSKSPSDGEGSSSKGDDREERHSIYDNVPLVICNKSYHDYQSEGVDVDMALQEGSGSSEGTMESRESPLPSNHEEVENARPIRRATVDRWHSFNRKSNSYSVYSHIGTQISGFSVGQMNHLRKRALLKLTALMERYCPTNRTAWNWELPKFIRKIKSPDYKDRRLFGVPLQVINQRTGYPLPPGIQQALAYLKTNCIDQVGIFRKPGVRSRIQKLRELHENEDEVQHSTFGPCDIADMVKTYFRELPEVLLTNKLSEIFIAICQYLPIEVRLEALQCVMAMMPDENREVLMALLSFLSDVAANAHLNQMTASNLAVCMAPSLFHLNMGGSGSSPLRRKTTGSPEQKDLHDNKAAHQCLTLMIQQVSNMQCLPMEMLSNCRFSFLDLSQPVALEDLGSAFNMAYLSSQGEGDWGAYMNACIDSLLKETREKPRGWVHIGYPDSLVEVGYRKVGDGHPLRLWKVTTEVEAPPTEVLTRVLGERHLWDESLLKWRIVTRLNRQAEVFQYMCNSMPPRPAVDYCVLRCWRTDLGKGLCVVVETSVEHRNASLLVGCSRGIVLASRYMIQPCGSGKSRITHISRVDMRGRLPEWYNKNYAFYTANHIVKLRQSFQHFATGPESKV